MASIINSEEEFDELMIKLNNLTVIDNLTTNDAANPLSAKQGKILDEKITTLLSYTQTGWIPITATLTYTSSTTVTLSADITGIHEGTKLKFTQDGVIKKFFVTKKSGLVLTLFGGTDYTLTNTAITNVFFSNQKAPLDFPTNPEKWTITFKNTTEKTVTSPTINTWYNLSGLSIALPTGTWKLSYSGALYADGTNATKLNCVMTLSTNTTGESDSDLSTLVLANNTSAVSNNVYRDKIIEVSTPVSYYCNVKTLVSGVSHIGISAVSAFIMRAECAYL